MFCSYCATPLADDLAFCTNCGKPTRNFAGREPETVIRNAPTATDPNQAFVTESAAAPRRSKAIWFLLGGLSLILIGFGGMAIIYFSINRQVGNTAKNVINANAATPRNVNFASPTVSPAPTANSNTNTGPSPTPAPAINGSYKNKMGDVSIEGSDAKGFDFEFGIATRGCAGGVDGKAAWTKQNVSAVAKVKNEDWEYDPDLPNIKQYCTLTFNFSGGKVNVTEDSCLWFHGAACQFEGNYIKK